PLAHHGAGPVGVALPGRSLKLRAEEEEVSPAPALLRLVEVLADCRVVPALLAHLEVLLEVPVVAERVDRVDRLDDPLVVRGDLPAGRRGPERGVARGHSRLHVDERLLRRLLHAAERDLGGGRPRVLGRGDLRERAGDSRLLDSRPGADLPAALDVPDRRADEARLIRAEPPADLAPLLVGAVDERAVVDVARRRPLVPEAGLRRREGLAPWSDDRPMLRR